MGILEFDQQPVSGISSDGLPTDDAQRTFQRKVGRMKARQNSI